MAFAGPYCALDAESTPIVREWRVTSMRAARLGRYCISAMTCVTRADLRHARRGRFSDARMIVEHPRNGLV